MKKDRTEQFYRRMAELIGEGETRELLEALKEPAPKAVRYNRGLCSSDEPAGVPVPWNEPYGRYWPEGTLPSQTIEYAAGKYYIQEAGAMLAISAAAKAIDFSDKIVLDLTAAPGGKATQVAELITSGYLVANEVIKKRVAALTWNINRHRLDNVIVTSLPTRQLAGSLPGFFDIVIVDAPCSGEGLFQKGKHSLAHWSEKNVLFCARRQKSILRDAVNLLRPDGFLVYSTCTFAREENEDQVEYLLTRELTPLPFPAGLPVSPAVTADKDIALCCGRIFPHREGGAGAFVSLLQNKSSNENKIPANKNIDFVNSKPKQVIVKPGSAAARALDPTSTDPRDHFYEKNGVISHLPHDKIPMILQQKSLRIGAPIMDKLRDNQLMFGAVQAAAPAAVKEVTRQQAEAYIAGEDIRLDLSDGYYFVAFRGMVLGPVRILKGKTINKFPRALMRRKLKVGS